jgi:transposase
MDAKKATAIVKWIDRIKKSTLPISTFFDKHDIPFSRAQYFIYKRRLEESGPAGLIDKRCMGGNRKITLDQETFLKGIVKRDPEVSLGWLQQALMEEFSCEISLSAVSRALNRIVPERGFKVGGRPKTKKQSIEQNALLVLIIIE